MMSCALGNGMICFGFAQFGSTRHDELGISW